MKLFHKLSQTQKLVSLPPTATVLETIQLMSHRSVGAMLVMDGEELVGIFTERDLLNRVNSKGLDVKTVKLSDVMSKNVVTIDINASLEGCYAKMQDTKSRHVPIVNGNKVVGMVTMRNILEWLWKEIDEENVQLKQYIQSS